MLYSIDMNLNVTMKRLREVDKYAEEKSIKDAASKVFEEELLQAQGLMYSQVCQQHDDTAKSIWAFRMNRVQKETPPTQRGRLMPVI